VIQSPIFDKPIAAVGPVAEGAGTKVPDDGKCPEDFNKVLVQYSDATTTRPSRRDYHFVRQRSDGTWCDKHGLLPEKTYPAEPRPFPTYVNCGYLCIKKGWDIDASQKPKQ
jgi:hypothetical protein